MHSGVYPELYYYREICLIMGEGKITPKISKNFPTKFGNNKNNWETFGTKIKHVQLLLFTRPTASSSNYINLIEIW